MKKALFAAVSLLALAACEKITEPVVCPAYIPPSVIVTVQDSVTGANVTPGATLVLHNATYSDSVVAPPIVTAMSVGFAAGTFTLTVRQSGYMTWTKTGIRVEAEECGAKTVSLVARLQPAA